MIVDNVTQYALTLAGGKNDTISGRIEFHPAGHLLFWAEDGKLAGAYAAGSWEFVTNKED